MRLFDGIAFAISLANLVFVIELVRVRRLKEEYSILWIASGILMVVLSAWREGLEVFAQWIGISYPPAALFIVVLFGQYLIILHYSISLSKLSSQVQRAHQELALLRSHSERSPSTRESHDREDPPGPEARA